MNATSIATNANAKLTVTPKTKTYFLAPNEPLQHKLNINSATITDLAIKIRRNFSLFFLYLHVEVMVKWMIYFFCWQEMVFLKVQWVLFHVGNMYFAAEITNMLRSSP